MRKLFKMDEKPRRRSPRYVPGPNWMGTTRVTLSGIEMLLKREKFLDGTPLKTPVGAINALITLFHQVGDGREDMRDMITLTWTRLQTIDTALMQSNPKCKITNERMDEFAKVLITQLSKFQLMASRSLLKRTLTSGDDIRALKRIFQDLEASTKDFHLATSLSIERNTATILSDLKNLLLNSFPRSRQARYDADVDSEAVGVTRGECTPKTRVEIIQRLVEWARQQSSDNSASIYWLNGSAGTGKSTIAYSVCKALDAQDINILGASFFCSRQLAELRERKYIIPSIVYQLARYSRSFATALLKANLDSADSSAKQMKDLLVEPWQKSTSDRLPDFPPCLVVVDALDEVQGGWEFLSELISTVEAGRLNGLKFLITSRREPKLVARCTALSSDFICHLEEATRDNVQCDILTFLSAELPDLHGTHELDDLAKRADGLFVHAATAVRFISRGYGGEQLRQLKSLLQAWPTQSDSVDMLPVDHLYSQVLQDVFGSVGETLRCLKILYTILCTEEPVSIDVLSGLICDPACDVVFTGHVIEDLHAVLYVSKHDGHIYWYHKSFYDFMCNSERSRPYQCDTITQQALLARGCFTIMERDLHFNICNLPSSFLLDSEVPDLAQRKEKFIVPLLRYVCRHWAQHLLHASHGATAKCKPVKSAMLKLRAFCDGQLLFWIETMNIIGQSGECSTALRIAHEALKVQYEAEDEAAIILSHDLKDAWNFAISFTSNALAVSTPYLYSFALDVYDGESKYLHRWKKSFTDLPRLWHVEENLQEAVMPLPSAFCSTQRLDLNNVIHCIMTQVFPWRNIKYIPQALAQEVMNKLQSDLDLISSGDSEDRRRFIKCLRSLSALYNILPAQLYVPASDLGEQDNVMRAGGAFSDICRARYMGESVCLKILRIHSTGTFQMERVENAFRQEALIWRQVSHRNILAFYGISIDVFPGRFCFISPWMEHGTVNDFLESHPDHDRWQCLWDIAAGMEYLHGLNPCIIHKDIRGANVLVGKDFRCCLADFGISFVVETQLPGTSTRTRGNIRWLPPELINESEFDPTLLKEVDVYSFGWTIVEIYTGKPPHSDLRTDGAVASRIASRTLIPPPPPPDILPPYLWNAVVAPCISPSPQTRPSARTILDALRGLDAVHRGKLDT